MVLPASGEISYNDINIELGNASGSAASMLSMTNQALGSPTITNEPDAISDWYGYTHVAHTCYIYGREDVTLTVYVRALSDATQWLVSGTTRVSLGDVPTTQDLAAYKSSTQTPFEALDAVSAKVYSRTTHNTGLWSQRATWGTYESDTYTMTTSYEDYSFDVGY